MAQLSNQLNIKSFDKFLSDLCYFGGNLSIPKAAAYHYHDLEEFVIRASNFMGEEVRVTTTFLNWLIKFGVLLSPSKLRRLLKLIPVYDKAIMGAFVEILKAHDDQNKNYNILNKYVRRNKTIQTLYTNLPMPKNPDPSFYKYGVIYYPILIDFKKYLRPIASIVANVSEIKYRAEGIGVPSSDLRAFLDHHKDRLFSLYEIAKRTHHPRTSINLSYRLFKEFGTI